MKKFVLLEVIFLVSCFKLPNQNEFDLSSLVEICRKMEIYEFGGVDIAQWPEMLIAIDPLVVRRDINGLYIVMDSYSIDESGFFCSYDEKLYNQSASHSYTLIGNNVYSFISKN
ncbi:hypothetical protein [Teredinibacter turnerae]|uniref:hypothetical protein n=1 Tax=Teredinibacter turnerae TaxID=2426 RepID=UPI0005A113D6|nr:hypothetical protein [Teredinibacter turnerae]